VSAKVEVLVNWHPDEGGSLMVFVDGVHTPVTEEWVDPGRGYELSSWRESTESVLLSEDYSPAFRDHVLAARFLAEDSSHIDDDIAHFEITRDEGQEPDFKFRCGYWKGDITTLRDDEVYLTHSTSREANQALAEWIVRQGYTNVHLEEWQPDIDQGPLNRGWGLYGPIEVDA
jgi:hypothetical protein